MNNKIMEDEPSEVCSPSDQCELCPHHWRLSIESVDETVKGEFESCTRWGRRERFDCTLFYGRLANYWLSVLVIILDIIVLTRLVFYRAGLVRKDNKK